MKGIRDRRSLNAAGGGRFNMEDSLEQMVGEKWRQPQGTKRILNLVSCQNRIMEHCVGLENLNAIQFTRRRSINNKMSLLLLLVVRLKLEKKASSSSCWVRQLVQRLLEHTPRFLCHQPHGAASDPFLFPARSPWHDRFYDPLQAARLSVGRSLERPLIRSGFRWDSHSTRRGLSQYNVEQSPDDPRQGIQLIFQPHCS